MLILSSCDTSYCSAPALMTTAAAVAAEVVSRRARKVPASAIVVGGDEGGIPVSYETRPPR